MAKKALNAQLIIIDPQIDFCGHADGQPYKQELKDGTVLSASLPVSGAVEDMGRLAKLIDRVGHKLSDISVTLDSHHTMHIAHPDMWVGADGKPPAPFTEILASDMRSGIWRARNQAHQKRFLAYLESLEAAGNFKHRIWAPHCRIGTWGHAVFPELQDSLTRWERAHMGVVNYVTKGSSVWTEHFGALMAEVPDPEDPSTQLNTEFLDQIDSADIPAFCGEALDFCKKTTMLQIIRELGEPVAKKMVLLTDCSSAIFPDAGKAFLADMQARGVKLMTSDQFLAS